MNRALEKKGELGKGHTIPVAPISQGRHRAAGIRRRQLLSGLVALIKNKYNNQRGVIPD